MGNRKSDRGWKGKARAMNPAEIPILDKDEDLYAPIAGPPEQQRPHWTQEDLNRMDAMECEQDTQGYFCIAVDELDKSNLHTSYWLRQWRHIQFSKESRMSLDVNVCQMLQDITVYTV
jgi:hypothetical protein